MTRVTTLASKLGLELALIHTDTTASVPMSSDSNRTTDALDEFIIDNKATVVGNVSDKTCFVVVRIPSLLSGTTC
jgi:phosphoribosylpyrophosphate synthetase